MTLGGVISKRKVLSHTQEETGAAEGAWRLGDA